MLTLGLQPAAQALQAAEVPAARAAVPAAQAAACAGAGCGPAALLNDTLLSASASRYYATSAEKASLAALSNEAIANTIADHALPGSDAAAVQTWGREDAEAELWGLIVKAIRTAPASRTTDQQNAVTWLTDVMHRKAQTAALDAGWEFLKWAGRVSGTDPIPSPSTILDALNGFANGSLQPVNYMNGTPDNSTSGFCAYRAPVGFDGDYTGNLTTPVLQRTADSWCYPPYRCNNLLGCNNNEPSFAAFVKWGEADVTGDPSKDTDFASMSHNVATGLEFGAAAVGAGVVGATLAAALGPVMTSSALTTAIFPYTAAAIADFGMGVTAQLPAEFAGAAAAGAVGAVVTVAIIAIAIAVIKGIQVAADAALPGQLHDLITNAMSGTPDLPAMLANSDQLGGLYALFVRATGPAPKAATCDNSGLTLNADGTAPRPCANAPAIPDVGGDDPQFLVQPADGSGNPSGDAVRSNTLTWLDAVATGQTDAPFWTSSARLSGNWFVTSAKATDGTALPAYQTLRLHYVSLNQLRVATSWLVKQPDGSYKFLTITGDSLWGSAVPPAKPIDPSTCVADGTCALTDSILAIKPDASGGLANGSAQIVKVVPAVHPDLTIGHSPDPVEGSPVTFTASATGADVGQLTYTWYVQPVGGTEIDCTVGDPFCGYDGPFTGDHVDYTWQRSGTYQVILLAADSGGRTFRQETDVSVGDVAPRLSVDPVTGPVALGSTTTVTGSVDHAGSQDSETVSIAWGDGTTDSSTYVPGNADCPCDVEFSKTSATQLGFTGKHAYSSPGSHTVTVKVTDQGGGTDSATLTLDVIGTQVLSFPAIADHTYGDPAFDVTVTGGGSGQPVELTSSTPTVCTLSDPADHDATASVTLRAAGTCTLEANQAGDEVYQPAEPVDRSFTIAPAPLTITAADKTMLLHNAVPALTVGYSGFVDGDTAADVHAPTCTTNDGTGHPVTAKTAVGTYAITCSGATAANYRITYQAGTLSVTYRFGGFPLLKSGTHVNTAIAGLPVPIVWLVTDGRKIPVLDAASFTSITVAPMTCGGTVPTGGTSIGPASGLHRYLAIFWEYTWNTSRTLKGTCQAMTLHLSDGTSHTALFKFR